MYPFIDGDQGLGLPHVYKPTEKGFRVHIKDPVNNTNADNAKQYTWHINWIAIVIE